MTVSDDNHLDVSHQDSFSSTDLTIDNRDEGDLSVIDVIQVREDTRSDQLKDLDIIVIGGGPAGLTFARSASSQGAKVTVLEKASDPSLKVPGYTDRSFNVTLDNVGRYILGEDRAWHGGIRLVGRAIHSDSYKTEPIYGKYGHAHDAELISLPRPMLRLQMAAMAREEGSDIRFNSKVINLNADAGTVCYLDAENQERTMTADLIVLSDGLHSLGDANSLHASQKIVPESRCYMTAILDQKDNHGLSLNHMHFWIDKEAQTTVLGIPNLNGTVALLLIKEVDVDEVLGTISNEVLLHEYPLVAAYKPHFEHNSTHSRKYRLQYKLVDQLRLGKRAVLVGDAAGAMPFWAGYGANGAMYSAGALVSKLVEYEADIDAALVAHEAQQKILIQLMMDFVKEQGDFLNGPVSDNPTARSDPALAPLIEKAQVLSRQIRLNELQPLES